MIVVICVCILGDELDNEKRKHQRWPGTFGDSDASGSRLTHASEADQTLEPNMSEVCRCTPAIQHPEGDVKRKRKRHLASTLTDSVYTSFASETTL